MARVYDEERESVRASYKPSSDDAVFLDLPHGAQPFSGSHIMLVVSIEVLTLTTDSWRIDENSGFLSMEKHVIAESAKNGQSRPHVIA